MAKQHCARDGKKRETEDNRFYYSGKKNPEEKKSAFVFMTKASRVQNEGNDNEFLFFDIQFFQRTQKMLPP